MSAGLCIVIFVSALAGSKFQLIPLLAEHREILGIIHLLGIALGVGGATIIDIFFFKFLKDFRISEWEAEVMRTLSNIIWFALAILVISGIGLFLPHAEQLGESPKFLLKVITVIVIIANGAMLNLLIAPKLIRISFREKHDHEIGELHRIRKMAFALGAISIVSWYAALILGAIRKAAFDFLPLLSGYLLLLLIGILISQLFEYAIVKKANTPDTH